jgi:hypothetical protein
MLVFVCGGRVGWVSVWGCVREREREREVSERNREGEAQRDRK